MPEGDRSGVIATVAVLLFIAVCIGLIIWDISAKHTLFTVQANQAAAEYAEQAELDIQETCRFADLGRQAECIEQIIVARREAQRAEKDLEAQRGMAAWALYGVGISGLMLLVTGTGVWFVKRTLDATHAAVDAAVETANTTRELGAAQIRAYVSVPRVVTARIQDRERRGHRANVMSLKLLVANRGTTPALRPGATLFVTHRHDGRDIPVAVKYENLLPSDILAGEREFLLFNQEFPLEGEPFDTKIADRTIHFRLWGNIDYDIASDKERHHTPFDYKIGPFEEGGIDLRVSNRSYKLKPT